MARQARTEMSSETPRFPVTRLAAALFLLVPVLASPALSAPPLPADDPLARQFAYCAGRLSAEAQHKEDRELHELKQSMQDLLAALIAPEAAPSYEKLRIAGHVAQSELLALSRFSFDEAEANRAAYLAAENIRICRGMLLDG